MDDVGTKLGRRTVHLLQLHTCGLKERFNGSEWLRSFTIQVVGGEEDTPQSNVVQLEVLQAESADFSFGKSRLQLSTTVPPLLPLSPTPAIHLCYRAR